MSKLVKKNKPNPIGTAFDKAGDIIFSPIESVVDGLSNALGVAGKSTSAAIDKIIDFLPEGVDPNGSILDWMKSQKQKEKDMLLISVKDPFFRKKIQSGDKITKDEYVNHITNGETPTWKEFEKRKLEGARWMKKEATGEESPRDMQPGWWLSDLKWYSKNQHPRPKLESEDMEFVIPVDYGKREAFYFNDDNRGVDIRTNDNLKSFGMYINDTKGDNPYIELRPTAITTHSQGQDIVNRNRYFADGSIAHELQHWLDGGKYVQDPHYRNTPYDYYHKQLSEQKAHAAEASAVWRLQRGRYPFSEDDVEEVYSVYRHKFDSEGAPGVPMNLQAFKILFRTVADNNNTEQDLKDILSSKENFA